MVISDVTSSPERDRVGQVARETGGGEGDGTRPRRRRRGTLSRQLIVERAIAIIDRDGVVGLTMRRLGEDLGVDAMTLYGYVTDRHDLLEAVVAHLVQQIELPLHDQLPARRDRLDRLDRLDDSYDRLGPREGWQGFLTRTAHSVRGIALAHPHLFPLIATRPPSAPWLRPPLRSLRLVEDFLDGLITRGFTPAQSLDTYRAFTSFLVGHLVLETAGLGATTSLGQDPLDAADTNQPDGPDDGAGGDLDLSPYPALLSLRQQLADNPGDAEFGRALNEVVALIKVRVSQ